MFSEMLNLDDISEEDIPIEEDDATECVLCMYTNHSYLDHMHHTLSSTTSKTNMYMCLKVPNLPLNFPNITKIIKALNITLFRCN